MTAIPETPRLSKWELQVKSDWITALCLLVLLVICAFLLFRDIEQLMLGQVRGAVPPHRNFWGIWDEIFEAIAAMVCFFLAFGWRTISVKIALFLMGVDLAGVFLLRLFHMSPNAEHVVAVSASVIRQISLVLICIAIAQWFRSVVHRSAANEAPGGES
jgi:hypothetical protein